LALCKRATRCGPVAETSFDRLVDPLLDRLVDPPIDPLKDPQLQRLWALCYLDSTGALALAEEVAARGGAVAVWGWWHVALAALRLGEVPRAQSALARSRAASTIEADGSARRHHSALCDELAAMALRRAGEHAASARLQADIDSRQDFERDPMFRFIAHNSRSITQQLLGQHDEGLRHNYACRVAADETGHPAPRIVALANLGSYHQRLFNLDDAVRLSEEALRLARAHKVPQAATVAAVNLIATHYAAGHPQASRDMLEFVLTHPQEILPELVNQLSFNLAIGHFCVGEIDHALARLEQGLHNMRADGDGLSMWTWLTARCLLAKADAEGALRVLRSTATQRDAVSVKASPYDQMEICRVQADACEQLGDAAGAVACLRQAQAIYEDLVGRSARARFIALDFDHQLARTQRERDSAVSLQRQTESDRLQLAELNAALQAKIDETQRLHAQLSEQALRDPLTGLHNRRYLFEVVPGMLELARRQDSPLCVVLLDLDHFKLLNDTYGHAAGDEVLMRFAELLTSTLRRSDIVSRHGGEEFVAVMPDMSADGARARIEALLAAFQVPTPLAGRKRSPRTTFSAGIAVYPGHGATLEQLLLRADRALYAAKDMGRARVELAPQSGFGALV
jgi:diguanylate cyclase (GGDEF)-like protein